MKTLNTYLSEIRSLQVYSNDEFVNTSKYYNLQPEFSTRLENLQLDALNELSQKSYAEVERRLVPIRRLEHSFSKFDTYYPDFVIKSGNGQLTALEFELVTGNMFNKIHLSEEQISQQFLITIYSSILSKHHSLIRFVNKIEDLLVLKSKNNMHVALPIFNIQDMLRHQSGK
jgi:hypothetical protein